MQSSRRELVLDGATVVMMVCTVALTAFAFFGPARGGAPRRPTTAVKVDAWAELISGGHRFGPKVADPTIVVFSDFECPFCAQFALGPFKSLRERYGEEIAFVFRHAPLSMHAMAYPAARAAECSARQGRFEAFHDAVFAKQDSLSTKPLRDYAMASGVADLAAFDECMSAGGPDPVVEVDLALAKKIGFTGTPTIVVNGWMIPNGNNPAVLDSAINAHRRK